MVNSGKPVILTVISLLVIILIYSSSSSQFVAAESPRDVCRSGGTCNCINEPGLLFARCCFTSIYGLKTCKICEVNTETGDYVNCNVYNPEKPTTRGANVPQGGGSLEQPSTPKKHGGTTLPKGGGLEQP